jgi:hypothetical protein
VNIHRPQLGEWKRYRGNSDKRLSTVLKRNPISFSILALIATASFGTLPSSVFAQAQKTEDPWNQSRATPSIVVAKLSADRKAIDLLVPKINFVTESVPYTVQVPVEKDGVTTTVTETRTRTVQKSVVTTERRQIAIETITAHRMTGEKLTDQEIAEKLKSATHVLFGILPDAFARAVFKQDLVVLIESAPPMKTNAKPISNAGRK